MAIKQDITFYKGENVTLAFTQVCTTTTAANPDITGWTIRLNAQNSQTDTGNLFTKSATLTLSTAGQYTLNFTSTDTTLLAAGQYPYDVRRIDVGSEAVLSIGNLHIISTVLYP